jgi:hypothetical protein
MGSRLENAMRVAALVVGAQPETRAQASGAIPASTVETAELGIFLCKTKHSAPF